MRSNRSSRATCSPETSSIHTLISNIPYYVEVGGQKHPMTFDRDVYDRNPEIGFMTYRHPVFDSLLVAALNP